MTRGPRVYLLDVEGTVAPLSLVTEQLFPYARRHVEPYLRAQVREPWIEAELAADLMLLAEENTAEDGAAGAPVLTKPGEDESWESTVPQAAAYLLWLMDRDRKSTALKSLQGRVWREGFESGALVGTVFDDVPRALEQWSQQARVAIYSSGSVEAQRLLFQYSSAGDLTPYLAAHFDTRVGPKREAASYQRIAESMAVKPQEILFCSDVVQELDAAREAGCETRLVVRPGNAPVAENSHSVLWRMDNSPV
jgi:2,3-diketo-5-methylthio-1-phosphopentane phosphatase